jgi:hypothetical protein
LDTGFIMVFGSVVEFDSEAERTGTPSLVGHRLPPEEAPSAEGLIVFRKGCSRPLSATPRGC